MKDTDTAETQAKIQLASIAAMVQRLEHTRECSGKNYHCDLTIRQIKSRFDALSGTDSSDIFNEYHDEDAASQALDKSPLSVLVRSGWVEPLTACEQRYCESPTAKPIEYEILLYYPTGGPTVRIRGTLGNDGKPETARLEYKDSGTPWTLYSYNDADDVIKMGEALLAYARLFYYGG